MTSAAARPPGRPVALVTGGSRGIGRATAEQLAAQGWDLVIGYRADDAAAAEVVAVARSAGARAVAVAGDVADEGDVATIFAAAATEFGRLDAVVANAGIVVPAATVDTMTAERIEQVLRVNVVGALLTAGAAVRAMSTARGGTGGVILLVSSRAAVLGGAGEYVDYAASKGAVDSIVAGLAAEVVDQGIRVVGVRPGIIATDIHAPGRVERKTPDLPMKRPGTAEEVAAAVAWLLSPAASYVTGALLDVGGGR